MKDKCSFALTSDETKALRDCLALCCGKLETLESWPDELERVYWLILNAIEIKVVCELDEEIPCSYCDEDSIGGVSNEGFIRQFCHEHEEIALNAHPEISRYNE